MLLAQSKSSRTPPGHKDGLPGLGPLVFKASFPTLGIQQIPALCTQLRCSICTHSPDTSQAKLLLCVDTGTLIGCALRGHTVIMFPDETRDEWHFCLKPQIRTDRIFGA